MRLIGWDTETHLIVKHGKATRNAVPRFVCLAWWIGDKGQITRDPIEALDLFESWIADENTRLIAHNAAYDIRVMLRLAAEHGRGLFADVFRAYEEQRVADTLVRELLGDIAKGGKKDYGYDLATLEKTYLGRDRSADKKGGDVWRLRYAELAPYPIALWPQDAIDYAIADAEGALKVYKKQADQLGHDAFDRPIVSRDPHVANELLQTCADLAFSLGSANGLATDPIKTSELLDYYADVEADLAEQLKAAGLMRASGTLDKRATQKIVLAGWESLGLDPLLTDKGPEKIAEAESLAHDIETWDQALEWATSSQRETLEELRTEDDEITPAAAICRAALLGAVSTSKKDALLPLEKEGYDDPRFITLSKYNQATKFQSTYLEPIRDAYPYALCPYYSVLVDSGRSSSAAPNIQNIPARGKGAEIRGCFVPRPGNVYVQCDYSTLELRTLAQVCLNLGFDSEMAKALIAGRDLHLDGAAQVLGISYEEAETALADEDHPLHKAVKHERRTFKIANFGYPGGLGVSTFVDYAAAFGTTVTLDQSAKLKTTWQARWPEMALYFEFISASVRYDGKVPIRQHGPHGVIKDWRTRLCDRFTSACNTLFQGLAADLMKFAMWNVIKACYADKKSPLYGYRLCAMIHDELILEGPEAGAKDAAAELSRLMEAAGGVFCPGVPIVAEPEIMPDRWIKG